MKQTVAMIICFIMGILAYIFYSLENCYDKERRISDMAIAKDNNESVIKRVDFLKTINMNDANLHFGESDKRFRVTSIPGELCSEYRFQDGCHVFNIILANRGFLEGMYESSYKLLFESKLYMDKMDFITGKVYNFVPDSLTRELGNFYKKQYEYQRNRIYKDSVIQYNMYGKSSQLIFF